MRLETPRPKGMHPVVQSFLILLFVLAVITVTALFFPANPGPAVTVVTPTTKLHPLDAERRLRQLADEKTNPFKPAGGAQ